MSNQLPNEVTPELADFITSLPFKQFILALTHNVPTIPRALLKIFWPQECSTHQGRSALTKKLNQVVDVLHELEPKLFGLDTLSPDARVHLFRMRKQTIGDVLLGRRVDDRRVRLGRVALSELKSYDFVEVGNAEAQRFDAEKEVTVDYKRFYFVVVTGNVTYEHVPTREYWHQAGLHPYTNSDDFPTNINWPTGIPDTPGTRFNKTQSFRFTHSREYRYFALSSLNHAYLWNAIGCDTSYRRCCRGYWVTTNETPASAFTEDDDSVTFYHFVRRSGMRPMMELAATWKDSWVDNLPPERQFIEFW